MLAFVGVFTVLSLVLLVDCGALTGSESYEDVGEAALPFWGRLMVVVSIMLGLFGALVAFLVSLLRDGQLSVLWG